MKISFFGATEEVTGSRYLIQQNNVKILVDCGLFQGDKELRERNWDALPVDPSSIHAVILTHAHIDHSGYLPVLIKRGFKGPIYCSKATYDLCIILLLDSAFLHEQDAKRRGRRSSMKIVPLYTQDDARRTFPFFKVVDSDTQTAIKDAFTFKLMPSGHILGASFVILSAGKEILTFTGDIGRPNQFFMKPPTILEQTDYLVLDSTYGDRLHDPEDPIQELGVIINRTVARRGVIIIPAFAVGRTQSILYCLHTLLKKGVIKNIPIYLDSPMAQKVIELYPHFTSQMKISAEECKNIFSIATFIDNGKDSKRLNYLKDPAIIIAGSGMADGGRVLDHLTYFGLDTKNSIIFVGYQAYGTIGRKLVDGIKKIKVGTKSYTVRAEIDMINAFSAHADYNELLEWLAHFKQGPKKIFLTHGNIASVQSLQKKIVKRFGWDVIVPRYLESFDLD